MKKILAGLSLALLPGIALADIPTGISSTAGGLTSLVKSLTSAANALIPFLLAIAVVVFIYGVIKYILVSGAEEKAAARGYIIYGIIGIAVIVSLFGLINLLQSTFGVNGNTNVNLPQF